MVWNTQSNVVAIVAGYSHGGMGVFAMTQKQDPANTGASIAAPLAVDENPTLKNEAEFDAWASSYREKSDTQFFSANQRRARWQSFLAKNPALS